MELRKHHFDITNRIIKKDTSFIKRFRVVCLDGNNVVATDGHSLYVLEASGSQAFGIAHSTEWGKTTASLKKGDKVSHENLPYIIPTHRKSEMCKLYADYESAMPKGAPDATVYVSPKYLREAARAMEESGSTTAKVELYNTNAVSPLLLLSGKMDGGENISILIATMRHDK